MAITRTGTASQVDASGGNGSTSVTVPADCTAVVALWSHFDGNAGTTLSALTLNGVSFFPALAQLAEGAVTDEAGIGVALLASPATGSQTLAWMWSAGGARGEGGEIVLVYLTATGAISARDSAVNATTASTNLEVTVSSQTTDIVIAFAQSFSTSNPAISGTVFINNVVLNSQSYDVSEVTAGAGTTTVTMTGEDYSGMAAVSLQETSGAITGSIGMTVTPTGTLTGSGALAGSVGLTVTPTGALTGSGALAGSVPLALSATGALGGSGALAGSVSLAFDLTGELTDTNAGAMTGSVSLATAVTGALTGSGALAGSVAMALDVAGVFTSVSTAEVFSGGFFMSFEREFTRRRREKREREKAEEEAQQAQDEIDRQIAALLHAQEAKDAEAREFARLKGLVARFADREAEVAHNERVAKALTRAVEKGSDSAFAALEREVQRQFEEEEFLVLMLAN